MSDVQPDPPTGDLPGDLPDGPPDAPSLLTVRPATRADQPVLERLWLMFRHDMAEFEPVPERALPAADGTYRSERLAAALTGGPDWAAYLLQYPVASAAPAGRAGPQAPARPVGFAFVRALSTPTAVMNSFFVARGVRRHGLGRQAARQVMTRHPGRWEVPFQDRNPGAVRFWRRVATDLAGDTWHEERRPVPGIPGLPPDVWISFETRPGQSTGESSGQR